MGMVERSGGEVWRRGDWGGYRLYKDTYKDACKWNWRMETFQRIGGGNHRRIRGLEEIFWKGILEEGVVRRNMVGEYGWGYLDCRFSGGRWEMNVLFIIDGK